MLGQSLGPLVMGFVANKMEAPLRPDVYGNSLASTVTLFYSLAIPFWLVSGKIYQVEMEKRIYRGYSDSDGLEIGRSIRG
jgi:hypothetical protein